MSAHIKIDPPLKCEFLDTCDNLASRAIIWKSSHVPTRWIMMPVCLACFSAAVMEHGSTPPEMKQLTLQETQ